MADAPKAKSKDPEYPPLGFPAVFADGIYSGAWDAGLVRIYLARFDPDLHAGGQNTPLPSAQIVMPIMGFARSFVFFEKMLARLIHDKHVTEADLENMRREWD